jgi:hypothetical protein
MTSRSSHPSSSNSLKYLLVRCWAPNPDDRPDFVEIEEKLQQQITEGD